MTADLTHAWTAERFEDRLHLFEALKAAGFTPRDPRLMQCKSDWKNHRLYHDSWNRRPARMGRKLLYPDGSHPGEEYMDHREDWKHPDHPQLWTALSTWHVHGCLTERGVRLPDHCKGPPGYPKAWCGPSWYFPRAITGVVWHPDVEHLVAPAIEAFRVDR